VVVANSHAKELRLPDIVGIAGADHIIAGSLHQPDQQVRTSVAIVGKDDANMHVADILRQTNARASAKLRV
jgi:hypothetical protein